MRPDNADEFAGSDDSGFLPELWEMALVAGDQVVRAGGIGSVLRHHVDSVVAAVNGAKPGTYCEVEIPER
jgi:hypothetical protein